MSRPQPPQFRSNGVIPHFVTGCLRAEPLAELLKDDLPGISRRMATRKARQDGTNFGIIFVSVVLEVDSDWIGSE